MSTYSFYLRRAALIVVFTVVVIVFSFAYKWLNPLPVQPKCHNETSTNSNSTRRKRSPEDEYLINTPACEIPRTDIVNDEIRKLMNISTLEKYQKPHCHYIGDEYKPPLVASNDTALYVLKSAKQYYEKAKNATFLCSYTPFWRAAPDNKIPHRKFGQKTDFNDSVTMYPTTEFVHVICTSDNTEIYEDYFAFVPKKIFSSTTATQLKPNVLIFGMDSLSRGNFHRQMPQTASTLEKLNFIEYAGYTKVGDNTFPNLIPFLTGHTPYSELQNICWPNKATYFDECPFIWQKYKSKGYTTAFVEEQSWLSMFVYNGKIGFIEQPTDYYYNTFDRAASETIARKHFNVKKFCFGPNQSIDKFLDYITKLISTLKDGPLFGFFFASTISHDDLNLPRFSDSKYQNLFNLMENINLTQNSIIIFMSDHGLRFGKILETRAGFMERRMPLLTVSFPEWFPQKYPLAYANFKANSKRLTTHFDTYQTLEDLLDLDTTLTDAAIQQRTTRLNQLITKPRGISLFLPIPETRTCTQAGIMPIYCACINRNSSSEGRLPQEQVAQFLVSQINVKLDKFPACAQLSLELIMDVEYYQEENEEFVRVTVQTVPGRGNFQGVIKVVNKTYEKNHMEITGGGGSILRLNRYGSQKECAVDETNKLFCHCK